MSFHGISEPLVPGENEIAIKTITISNEYGFGTGHAPSPGIMGREKHGTGVKKRANKTSIIRGVVIPMDWDDQGNVVRIAISSHDEEEYMVEREGKGGELLAFIRKEVEVGGEIREEDHKKMIKVKKYQLAKAEESETRSLR
jgi:hypothetical protein